MNPSRVEGQPIHVVLPEDVSLSAWEIGLAREKRRRGTSHRESYGGGHPYQTREFTDGMAAVAECMFAFGLEVRWDGHLPTPDRGIGDVGPVDVRFIESDQKRLRVQPDDLDDTPYALVLMKDRREGHILGWAWGWFAKKYGSFEKRREDKPATYYLGKDQLRRDWRLVRLMVIYRQDPERWKEAFA